MRFFRSLYIGIFGILTAIAGGTLALLGKDSQVVGQSVPGILILAGVALMFFALPSPDQQRIFASVKAAKEIVADVKPPEEKPNVE